MASNSDNLKDAAKDVDREARDLASEAREAVHDATASSPVKDARRRAGEAYDRAKDAAEDVYGDVRDKASDAYDQARDRAQRLYRAGGQRASDVAHHAEDYYDDATDYVRRQPAVALGMAAGLGFLVGLILARR